MNPAVYLIDTSALARIVAPGGSKYGWDAALGSGLVGICQITELEYLYSAKSAGERESMVAELHEMMPDVFIPDRVYDRAWDVQELLSRVGKYRSAGPVDLIVAAAAELSNLTLVHCDNDFDAIASVTGQATQRLREPNPA